MPTLSPKILILLTAATAMALAAGCSRKEPPKGVAIAVPPPPAGPRPNLDPDPTRLPGALAPTPDGLTDVVYLQPDGAEKPGFEDPFSRELIRQALALAAREEFGLRVLDSALGEPTPARLPADRHLRVRGPEIDPQRPGNAWKVFAGLAQTEQKLWEAGAAFVPLGNYVNEPAAAVAAAEQLSRGRLKDCLVAARFAPQARRSDAAVPPEAEKLLRPMRETAQLAAVRLLHREARLKGESDALTAALAQGYANLALLTEFHWNPAPTAFKARALLYAQRLVARSPGSATARWHRAYAAALVGLHKLALDDLAAAAKLAAADPKAAPPPWAEVLDAYLHFDPDRLAAARARADMPLARLLQYLAVEQRSTPAATIRAGRAYLADNPECYRVHDGQCRTGGVAHLHDATLAGPAAFGAHFARRIRELPGLPAPVAAVLNKDELSEGALYAALRSAGDPATDRDEPTWAALASVAQEVRFTLAWHRLFFMGHWWAVPTEEAAREVLPALAGHPLVSLIESFTLDHRRDPAGVRRKLTAAPVGDLDQRASMYQARLRAVDPAAEQAWFGKAVTRSIYTYQEQVRHMELYASEGVSADAAKRLRAVSPYAPLAAVAAVPPGPEAAARLSEVEKAYAGHALVQRELGKRHLADGRPDDAVRCFGRAVELSPDGPTYLALADAHLAQGDEDRWKKTLEASLAAEDTGLDHARAQVALAERHMAKGEYEKAEPYALAAAESFAGWALLCAARCEEGLGKWDEAEKIYRTAAERYDDASLDWYFASRFTGKMNPAAAEAAAREFVAGLRGGVPTGEVFQVGRFYLLTGRPKEAREQFNRSAELRPTSYGALFAALLADAAGDTAARDKWLTLAATVGRSHANERAVAETIRAWATQSGAPDAAAVDGALAGRSPGMRADIAFFTGWLLANRGQKERARAHWERSAGAREGTRWLKTHARGFLDGGQPLKEKS